jgi:predicted component of viral defense system (DUF524 family)
LALINTNTYKFENDGCGSLELEIAETNRSFFQPNGLDKIPFKINGLLQSKEITPFYFFEWQKIQYSYIIEDSISFSPPFELRINNRTVNKSKVRGSNHLLAGQFSFDNEVGETKIELRDFSNKLIFELNTEVFPQKMDYKSDYKAMMADISEIIQNLAYDTLKDTFRRSKAKTKGRATENEWWNILDALFDQLIVNLGVIKRQPKHEIVKSDKVLPIEKIRSASKKNIDWFRKNSKYSNDNEQGIKVTTEKYFSHSLSTKKYVTYDTYENRFIAWAVRNIIEQLRQYKKYIETAAGANDYSPLINRLKMYQGRLQGLLHENPFDEVGKFEKRAHFSTSLTRGSGYRDFMHIYLLLTRGLELADNDIFKIEQKNISTLYEYWCFLKLVQILKEQNASEIDYQDLIKVRAGRLKVELLKGSKSKVVFKKGTTNETTTIYFNREFGRDEKKIFTYDQKPDYSVKFKKDGFEKPFWYLFDAKYRFDESSENENNFYNVPQDAIGQLHRYRDAILHTEPASSTYRGAIKNLGGIILYPYPLSEKEFESNVYRKSIEQVNIGALPFLPSKSELVSDLLNELINKRLPEEHYEQFIEMDNSEYLNKRNLWKEWVTIGVVPKEHQIERLKFISEKLIYHVPFVKNTNSKLYLSKKILICKSGSNEALLYDVDEWEILTDRELKGLGTTWNHRKEKYIALHLSNEKTIQTPDKIAPLKFRYATQEGLNSYLQNPTLNKSYFYLTNPDAARLYQELQKLNIDFKINWVSNDNDSSLLEFTIKDFKIYSSDKYPDLNFKCEGDTISLKSVLELIKL